MSNLSELFENSKKINIKDCAQSRNNHISNAYINKQGRLFGVTLENDDYLIIKIADINNRKIIAVEEASWDTPGAIKSSTYSTGKPFINMQGACRRWYGEDQEKWKHDLRFLERTGEKDYYEVIE